MKGKYEITFGTWPGNESFGVVGFRVKFSGETLTNKDIVDIVFAIRKYGMSKNMFVSLEGNFSEENESRMITLVKTLIDQGCDLRAISDGITYHQWFDRLLYLVVKVENRLEWSKFKAQAYILTITPDNMKEPDFAKIDSGTLLYADVSALTKTQIKEFLQNAKLKWGIWLSTPNSFEWKVK